MVIVMTERIFVSFRNGELFSYTTNEAAASIGPPQVDYTGTLTREELQRLLDKLKAGE